VPPGIKVVLLLVNEQPQPTTRAIQAVRPDVVQFHGSETPEWLSLLKQNTPLEIWKAIGVSETANLERAQRYKDAAHMVLYDAPAKKLPGGTGLAFDWSLLTAFKHTMPWGLAGGLTPATVAEAIRVTGAALVDTSSGVESAPGVKDVDKIAAFCQAARGL
jgi:phosphoribosylanthranilate isomerase